MGLEYLLLPDEHFVVDPNKVEGLKRDYWFVPKKQTVTTTLLIPVLDSIRGLDCIYILYPE